MANPLEFRVEPGETVTTFEELVAGAAYRVWARTGNCAVEWTSVLVGIEVVPQPPLEKSEVAPFFVLKFENGVQLRSRTGWAVSFYRVPIIR